MSCPTCADAENAQMEINTVAIRLADWYQGYGERYDGPEDAEISDEVDELLSDMQRAVAMMDEAMRVLESHPIHAVRPTE